MGAEATPPWHPFDLSTRSQKAGRWAKIAQSSADVGRGGGGKRGAETQF